MNEKAAMSIEDLIDDFSFLEDWEDRYRYVIELGKELEPLSEAEHSSANKVQGCVSQVWLVSDSPKDDDTANPRLFFRGKASVAGEHTPDRFLNRILCVSFILQNS